jgi:hypothetical protein
VQTKAIEIAQVLNALGDIGHDDNNKLTPDVMRAAILH